MREHGRYKMREKRAARGKTAQYVVVSRFDFGKNVKRYLPSDSN